MISVIIPSYVVDDINFEILKQSIGSLRATIDASFEIIIIDNGSIPEASKFMKQYAHLYVYKSQPIGWARCSNIGLSLCEGNYISIVNNDVVFQDNWWGSLIEAINYYDLGVASSNDGTTSIPDGTINYGRFFGACYMMNRETFVKIGYLDEKLNERFADQDYWCRMLSAGKKIGCVGNSHIFHYNEVTWSKLSNRDEANKREREIMVKKWGYAHAFEWIKEGKGKEIFDKLIS